jgi:hypothetical protein
MKKPILAVLLIAFFGAGFAALAAEPVNTPNLKDKARSAAQGSVIQLQPGVTVTRTGKNRVLLRSGQISGTFDCSCNSASGTGSCTLAQSGDTMTCGQAPGDPCDGSCTLTTKTKGIRAKLVM